MEEAFSWQAVRLEVLDPPKQLEPTEELVQDLLTIVTVFVGRHYGQPGPLPCFARLKVYTGTEWHWHNHPVKLSRYFEARWRDHAWESQSPKLILRNRKVTGQCTSPKGGRNKSCFARMRKTDQREVARNGSA